MDKLTLYLQRAGLVVTPAYWEKTRYLIGAKLTLSPYQVVFRLEASQLIICSVLRDESLAGSGATLLRLRKLLCDILHYCPEIQTVRGLVILDRLDEQLSQKQKKLQHILFQIGAITENIDGEDWLILPRSVFVEN